MVFISYLLVISVLFLLVICSTLLYELRSHHKKNVRSYLYLTDRLMETQKMISDLENSITSKLWDQLGEKI